MVRCVERLGRQSRRNRSLLEHELTVIDQVMRIAHRGERTTYSGGGTYDRETVAILDAQGLTCRSRPSTASTSRCAACSRSSARSTSRRTTSRTPNTEGYTRQEAVLDAEEPLANIGIWGMIFPGQLGQGVTVDSYRRIRDVFNDSELRAASSDQAGAEVRYRELTRHRGGDPRAGRQRHPGADDEVLRQLAGRRQQPGEPRRPPGAGAAGAVARRGVQRRLDQALANQRATDDAEIGGTTPARSAS